MINKQDCLGLTPLHYASLYGRTKAINVFLQKESSSIYIVGNNGESALHIAAFEGHSDAVEEILKSCPDSCYLVDNKGRTALHAAVLGDQRKVVKLILGRPMQGRVMNKADGDGNMALHLAAFYKLYNIIEILATCKNVDLNVKNKDFLTALDIFNKHDQVCVFFAFLFLVLNMNFGGGVESQILWLKVYVLMSALGKLLVIGLYITYVIFNVLGLIIHKIDQINVGHKPYSILFIKFFRSKLVI